MSGLAGFFAAHGAHTGEILGPIAWMAAVIVRARRRPPEAHSRPPGRPKVGSARVAPRLAWFVVVVGTAGAAAVHASIIRQHFGEGLIYGLFFTGLATGQLVLAGIIAWKRDLRVVAFTAAGAATTIALWLLTRLVGIPGGPESGQVEPFGALDVIASSIEAATVVAGLYLLRRAPAGRRPPRRARLASG